jgi:hypothetical protein
MPFSDLASGATSGLFDLFLDTSQIGEFSSQYQFNLSDEKDLSGHAGAQTLTLNVIANVVPEPATVVLLAVSAIVFFGYGLRRRKAARTARPITFAQPDAPVIPSFPSHASPVSTACRAA